MTQYDSEVYVYAFLKSLEECSDLMCLFLARCCVVLVQWFLISDIFFLAFAT